MKKAYELALERLNREAGPSKKLTDEQRAQLAEIDKRFEAKIAEKKLQFESRIASSSFEEADKLRQELAEELAKLEAERDRLKDDIWANAQS